MTIVNLGLAADDAVFEGDYIGADLTAAPLAVPLRGESGGGGTHSIMPSAEQTRLQTAKLSIPLNVWKHIETYKGFRIESIDRPYRVPLFRGIKNIPDRVAPLATGTYESRTRAYSEVDKLAGKDTSVLPATAAKGPLQTPTLANKWVLVEDYKGMRIEKDNLGSKYRVTQMKNTGILFPKLTQVSIRGGFPTVTDARNFIDGFENNPAKKTAAVRSGVARDQLATLRTKFRARLTKLKSEWGPEGHVQTYKGVRINRSRRQIRGPDGEAVEVPVYRTKQKLVGISQTGPEGVSGLGWLGQTPSGVTEPAGIAVADTLDQMKAIVDSNPLAPTERGEPDGIGPAIATHPIEQLPGELDMPIDAPQAENLPIASMSTALNQNKNLILAGVGVAALVLFMRR